mmetsp:Transcript_54031/g.126174  ORF Transcript_54031/g.126174 Transcript_54031/m.126174 type:complete len:208 (+) Transcript_54031:1892-2515(+)
MEAFLPRLACLQHPDNTSEEPSHLPPSGDGASSVDVSGIAGDWVMLQHVLKKDLHGDGPLLSSLHPRLGLPLSVGLLNLCAHLPRVVPPATTMLPLPSDVREGILHVARGRVRMQSAKRDPTSDLLLDVRSGVAVGACALLLALRRRIRRRLHRPHGRLWLGRNDPRPVLFDTLVLDDAGHRRDDLRLLGCAFLCLALCRGQCHGWS